MKTKQYLSILCMMLLISSCIRERECKAHKQCPIEPLMLEYFGNYKPGNYWIYENQDGTKRDSIWVSDYNTKQVKIDMGNRDGSDCVEYTETRFKLFSRYWGEHTRLSALLISSTNCNNSSFSIEDTFSYGLFGASVRKNESTFPSMTQIFNFKTHNQPAIVYPVGYIYQYRDANILIAPNIGVIQFTNRYLTDTFSIIKYHIQ